MDVILKAGIINSACYPMECNNNQVTMPDLSCAYLVNNTLYLNPCETDYFCQIGFETSYCIPHFEVPIPLSYPGEPCIKSSDCIYGICNYGYCQGQQQGFPCSLSAECAPGLYCTGGECIDLISAGSGTCVTDFDCINSAGCLDGTCVAYFSLAVGASVSACASQFSEFCSTATC
jgi:hypothetical protein